MFVVPVEVDATIELTFPVNVDFVMLFDSLFEVLAMVKADGLYAKVVYHKAEGDWLPSMSPETWGVLTVIARSLLANRPAWGRPYIPSSMQT